MSRKTIADTKSFVPTEAQVKAIDENFTENYASIADIESSLTLVEYADNAAAKTAGLVDGDLYMTEGAVKVVYTA